LWLNDRGLPWSWATSITLGPGGKRPKARLTAPTR
jgi:hypothetical protein